MDNPRNDALLGLFLAACSALVLFVLIPGGVDSPTVYDPGQLPPAAYPTWIATAALCLSVLLALVSFARARRLPAGAARRAAFPWGSALRLAAAFGLLLLFWAFIEDIGMIAGSFILYAAFAALSGERRWGRLFLVDVCLCGLLYLFFVKIAALPVPLGPFASLVR